MRSSHLATEGHDCRWEAFQLLRDFDSVSLTELIAAEVSDGITGPTVPVPNPFGAL